MIADETGKGPRLGYIGAVSIMTGVGETASRQMDLFGPMVFLYLLLGAVHGNLSGVSKGMRLLSGTSIAAYIAFVFHARGVAELGGMGGGAYLMGVVASMACVALLCPRVSLGADARHDGHAQRRR